MISKLAEKLRDVAYRNAFVGSQINVGIPFQIRALMKARRWTQAQLAEKTDMLQPRISGLMTPGKSRPNIETLRRVAEAFDCGLVVRFAPFSELARWSATFDPEHFEVPSFDEEWELGAFSTPKQSTQASFGFVSTPSRQIFHRVLAPAEVLARTIPPKSESEYRVVGAQANETEVKYESEARRYAK